MLADMGADVIKIEKSPNGDDTRHSVPPKIGDEAASFLMMNRNKRGIVLDLKTEGGKQVLRRLIADADVLVENFAPGAMERLGFGYEILHKQHPALIYCSLSGFGRTGPYKHRRGFDLVAQAMSGIMSFTGERPDGPPVNAARRCPTSPPACWRAWASSLPIRTASRPAKGSGSRPHSMRRPWCRPIGSPPSRWPPAPRRGRWARRIRSTRHIRPSRPRTAGWWSAAPTRSTGC